MRKSALLITGAGGEIGHGLIAALAEADSRPIVTIDVSPLDGSIARRVEREMTGSILDESLLERILAEFEVDLVFHLAALLSTRAEFTPVTAHHVNVEGMIRLLEFAQRQGEAHGRSVRFVYPSSIAAYGVPPQVKASATRVREHEWNVPTTMYGCNKLYSEHLGRYYMEHYKQLSAERQAGRVDFRCVRFPGLISAQTAPSGGTSDYAPEMIHAAARGEPYACFVQPDARIPFMAMPDAVAALLTLASAPKATLTQSVYNVTSFNPSAEEIRTVVLSAFPDAVVTYVTDVKRQAIVNSWPADVDDGAARRDWGFSPRYDFTSAFADYLIPGIRERYGRTG